MNLLQLELKRVCRTRMTAILLAAALVLAVFMAYLPVTFVGWAKQDANGNTVQYTGLTAVQKRKEHQVSGTITPEILQEALAASAFPMRCCIRCTISTSSLRAGTPFSRRMCCGRWPR